MASSFHKFLRDEEHASALIVGGAVAVAVISLLVAVVSMLVMS